MFDPACTHCGARVIQFLGRLPIPASECRQRRQAMLALWIKHGHDEAEIRELVKGPLAIQPKTGLENSTACATPIQAKPGYRGKR